jgi:hypothetical protein
VAANQAFQTAATGALRMLRHVDAKSMRDYSYPSRKLRPKERTLFPEVRLLGQSRNWTANVYAALGSCVATLVEQEKKGDYEYTRYIAYELPDAAQVGKVLNSKNEAMAFGPKGLDLHKSLVVSATRHNTYAKREQVMDVCAAMLLTRMGIDCGTPLTTMPQHFSDISLGRHDVEANAYTDPTGGTEGLIVAARTHILDTTTSTMVFRASNLLDAAAILHRDDARPGETIAGAVTESADASASRAGTSTEQYMGELLTATLIMPDTQAQLHLAPPSSLTRRVETMIADETYV